MITDATIGGSSVFFGCWVTWWGWWVGLCIYCHDFQLSPEVNFHLKKKKKKKKSNLAKRGLFECLIIKIIIRITLSRSQSSRPVTSSHPAKGRIRLEVRQTLKHQRKDILSSKVQEEREPTIKMSIWWIRYWRNTELENGDIIKKKKKKKLKIQH